jgi:hypothetical protein
VEEVEESPNKIGEVEPIDMRMLAPKPLEDEPAGDLEESFF